MEIIRHNRSYFIWEGIALILLGIFAVALPVLFSIGIELVIGWLFLIGGVAQAVRTFKAQHAPGFWWALASAVLYIIIGILLIAKPLAGVLSLAFLLSIFFFLEGIAQIIWSLKLRPFRAWGWLLFSGLISLAMAFIIWSGWPATGLWVIGLLVGINLIFFGFTQLFIGLNADPIDVKK